MNSIQERLRNRPVVSSRAPVDSPLSRVEVISAMAESVFRCGVIAVCIDGPERIRAVPRAAPDPVIIGLWKRQVSGSEVYITPSWWERPLPISTG